MLRELFMRGLKKSCLFAKVYKNKFSKENKSNLIKEHLSYVNTARTKAQRGLN